MKKFTVLIPGTILICVLLFANGCQKKSEPVTPTESTTLDNGAAPEFDLTFPDSYADQVTTPVVPAMGGVLFDRYIQFLTRILALTDRQASALKNLYVDYNACLRTVREKIKSGEITTREDARAAVQRCVAAYRTAWQNWVSTLTDEQKTKLARLLHIRVGGMTGGIPPVEDNLLDEMQSAIPYDDALLQTYENGVVFGASAGTTGNTPVVTDAKGPRGFIGFLVRFLKLDDNQIAIAKSAVQAYNQTLLSTMKDLKSKTITKQQALAAIKAAHKTMMDTIYASLTAEQKAKWDKIFKH